MPVQGEVIPVAIPDDHRGPVLRSKSTTRVPMAGPTSGGARAPDPWSPEAKKEHKKECERQNQERIERAQRGQRTDMAGHFRAQSMQMRSRSVDTRQQPAVSGYDSVGAVSAGSTAMALGWGNQAFVSGASSSRASGFGASSASGTSRGDGRQYDEQFLAS